MNSDSTDCENEKYAYEKKKAFAQISEIRWQEAQSKINQDSETALRSILSSTLHTT